MGFRESEGQGCRVCICRCRRERHVIYGGYVVQVKSCSNRNGSVNRFREGNNEETSVVVVIHGGRGNGRSIRVGGFCNGVCVVKDVVDTGQVRNSIGIHVQDDSPTITTRNT